VTRRSRIVVVTGASSGIGEATARAFAARGDTVVVVARRAGRLEALVREIALRSPDSHALPGDLSERAFAEGVVEESVRRHGRIDVLVNNAAIPIRKVIYEVSPEDVEHACRVNFFSAVWTSLAALPAMLREGGGTIVNVSSFASKVVPTHETIYAATKCALNGFSEGLWNDLHGSGIHVALVHPGPIDTEIWSKGDAPSGYHGVKYPPSLVSDAILDAVDRRLHEIVVPRRNPTLGLARFLRLTVPGLLRWGTRRMDPVPEAAIERARARARGAG
jgi:short-subunit dehydrogenase